MTCTLALKPSECLHVANLINKCICKTEWGYYFIIQFIQVLVKATVWLKLSLTHLQFSLLILKSLLPILINSPQIKCFLILIQAFFMWNAALTGNSMCSFVRLFLLLSSYTGVCDVAQFRVFLANTFHKKIF